MSVRAVFGKLRYIFDLNSGNFYFTKIKALFWKFQDFFNKMVENFWK